MFWSTMQDLIIGGTFSWIVWVLFSTLRRYLIAKARTRLHETVLQRIDSSESLAAMVSSEAGRHFLDSLAVEETPREGPAHRILFGMQAGFVLLFFGMALMSLHHFVSDPEGGLMIAGTGALGLGLGFLVAAVASLAVSHRLGLLGREHSR